MGATRTYLTGFSHRVSHDEYVTIGEAAGLEQEVRDELDKSNMTEMETKGIEILGEGKPLWMRPSHDGLRVWIDAGGHVVDDTYS